MTDLLTQQLDSFYRRSRQRNHYKARLGNGSGDLYPTFNGTARDGYVWARVLLPSGNTLMQVRSRKHLPAYGAPVFVAQGLDTIFEVVEEDPGQAAEFWEEYGTGGVGKHASNHSLYGADPLRVQTLQYMPLLTRPMDTPSLSVYMEAYIYPDGIGGAWDGGEIDLTAYVPTGTNEQCFVITGLDTSTGNAVVYASDTVYVEYETGDIQTVPFTRAEVAAYLVQENFIASGAVRLYTGQTRIDLYDVFEDCRNFAEIPGRKNNYTATRIPTVDDDITLGYRVGSEWANGTSIYKNYASTAGAADWRVIGAATGTAGNVYDLLYVQGDSYQYSLQSNGVYFLSHSELADIGAQIIRGRTRGDIDNYGNVQNGDRLATEPYWAWYDNWVTAGELRAYVNGTPAAGSVPTQFDWYANGTAVYGWNQNYAEFYKPIVLPSLSTAAIAALTIDDGAIVYDSDTDTFKGRQNGTFTEFGGGGGVAVEEAGSSIVAAATTLDFKDFNVEDDGSNQAGIYHNINSIFQARLTLTSGSPYAFNSDVTSTTIYLSPLDSGDQIALYDGIRVKLYTLTEKTFPLTNTLSCTTTNASTSVTTADTSQLVAGMKVTGTGIPANTTISSITNSTTLVLSANATTSATNNLTFKAVAGWVLDLYVYPASGTTPKVIAVKWSTATTKPSRPTNNGFVTKNGDATARFVGSVMIDPDTDGQTCLIRGALAQDDKIKPKWLLSNAYNTIECKFAYDVEDAHSYSSVTTRAYDGNSTDNRGYVCLYSDKIIKLRLEVQAADIAFGSDYAYIGLGVDVTNASTYNFVVSAIASLRVSSTQFGILAAGGHTLYLVEAAVNAVTFQNCRFEILTEF